MTATATPQNSTDIVRTELQTYAKGDQEAADMIGVHLDELARSGGAIAHAVMTLGAEGKAAAIGILDELVQQCADEGPAPQQGAAVNNDGPSAQVAYLLAYNGRTGITVIERAMAGLLPTDVYRKLAAVDVETDEASPAP